MQSIDFEHLVTKVLRRSEKPVLTLAGVSFWIGDKAPWKGELCYSKSTCMWDVQAMTNDLIDALMEDK